MWHVIGIGWCWIFRVTVRNNMSHSVSVAKILISSQCVQRSLRSVGWPRELATPCAFFRRHICCCLLCWFLWITTLDGSLLWSPYFSLLAQLSFLDHCFGRLFCQFSVLAFALPWRLVQVTTAVLRFSALLMASLLDVSETFYLCSAMSSCQTNNSGSFSVDRLFSGLLLGHFCGLHWNTCARLRFPMSSHQPIKQQPFRDFALLVGLLHNQLACYMGRRVACILRYCLAKLTKASLVPGAVSFRLPLGHFQLHQVGLLMLVMLFLLTRICSL